MSKIRIVTDSTADIPLAVREELGIIMVPLKVHFANDTFLDALTIESDEFYEKLVQSPVLPTTSQPSPVDFLEIYKKLLEEPDTEIISIHLSAAMSGTYQSAVLAKSLLDQPEQLTIVDTKSASYGIGMLAVRAAQAAKEGKSVEEILAMIDSIRKQTKLYFAVGTLEFLQKGGRIGKASALFGALLNIKPILTIDDDGEVAPIDKVRGQKKAMSRIIELIRQDYEGKPLDIMVAHGKAPELADELGSMVKEHFEVKKYGVTSVGPVIGTHVGPGVTAVFVCPAE
jgi:DegV family protein with EDD domain